MLITTQRLTFAAAIQIGGRMWETISYETAPWMKCVVDTISKDILIKCEKTKTVVVTTTANCRGYYPQGILKETSFEKLLKEGVKLNATADAARQAKGQGVAAGIPQRESAAMPG